jgi:hypothetical protein
MELAASPLVSLHAIVNLNGQDKAVVLVFVNLNVSMEDVKIRNASVMNTIVEMLVINSPAILSVPMVLVNLVIHHHSVSVNLDIMD